MRTPEAQRQWTGWRTLLDLDEAGPRWGFLETAALLLWFVLAGLAIAQHVPWADEAQAWLLAGDVSWRTLFQHSLHYEGSGGLWHAFLKVLQGCGVSFNGMRWVILAIQGAAMAVLLACAPFPRMVRVLLPFTFFLLYQDTVVARSYCLFAVLVFPAAALLRSPKPRPLLLAFLLGLMANISVHSAVASGGLAIVAALLWRGRFLRNVAAMLVLALLWTVTVVSMSPAYDIDYAAGNNLLRSTAKLEGKLGIHAAVPPPLIGMPLAGLPQAPVPVHVRHGFARTWNKVARIVSVVTYPLAASRVLALLLLGLVVAQAAMQRRARRANGVAIDEVGSLGVLGLVPYGLMVAVFASLYLAPRHAGMVLSGFVVSAWLTWPARSSLSGSAFVLQRVTAGALAFVCVLQIGWTAHAVIAEHTLPYGPGRMTAQYLESRGVMPGKSEGNKLAGFYYFSIDPLLYLQRNPYFNQPPHRYWYWSTAMRTYMTAADVLVRHPDFIVVGGYENGPDAEITRDWQPVTPATLGVVRNDAFGVVPFFEAHGYHETRVFCGHSWMRATYAEQLCDTVLEPAPDVVTRPVRH